MKRSIKAQAAAFVEYAYYTAPDTRAAILAKLSEIVKERQDLAAVLAGTDSPAQDFAEIGPASSPDALAELNAATQRRRDALAADLAAKDTLFCEICRAMDAAGLTFTIEQIKVLKRLKMPETLAAALDIAKAPATIPAAERLKPEHARKLYAGLTNNGFISGPESAFNYHLAQQTNTKPKRPETALKWLGKPMQFCFFAWQLSKLMQMTGNPTIKESALCHIFGMPYGKNTSVRRYFSDLHQQEENRLFKYKNCSKITEIFETL